MTFYCPLCKSELTEGHYHRVLRIHQKEAGELEKLRKKMAMAKQAAENANQRAKQMRQKVKEEAEKARQQATIAERKRSERLMQGQSAKMKKLQDRIQMLERGTTPQIIGLADEKVLAARLNAEFPIDRIVPTGKGGDVLQFVVFNREEVGCIIYECKHTDHISGQHIAQTVLAKRTRQAQFGILVTTGKRKGFSGLDQDCGIFIVAQAGVLTLAHICRDSLVAMAKLRLDAAEKQRAAKRLMDFVVSPTCRTPLEQAISQAERAGKKLMQEVQQHFRDWRERCELYQGIHHDVTHIQTNITRVLDGEEPQPLVKPRFVKLALPALTQENPVL